MELNTQTDIDLNEVTLNLNETLDLNNLHNTFHNIFQIIKNKHCYLIFNGEQFCRDYNNELFINYLFLSLNYALKKRQSGDRIILILNLHNFSKKDLSDKFIFQIVKMFKMNEKQYEDIFKKILVINYKPGIKILYDVLKIFMTKKVKKIIEFKHKTDNSNVSLV